MCALICAHKHQTIEFRLFTATRKRKEKKNKIAGHRTRELFTRNARLPKNTSRRHPNKHRKLRFSTDCRSTRCVYESFAHRVFLLARCSYADPECIKRTRVSAILSSAFPIARLQLTIFSYDRNDIRMRANYKSLNVREPRAPEWQTVRGEQRKRRRRERKKYSFVHIPYSGWAVYRPERAIKTTSNHYNNKSRKK